MNLREYLKTLDRIVESNPVALDWLVIYSRDDEGNEFQKVIIDPVPGNFDNSEFTELNKSNDEINAVCIN